MQSDDDVIASSCTVQSDDDVIEWLIAATVTCFHGQGHALDAWIVDDQVNLSG